jgi:gas vesicle protein
MQDMRESSIWKNLAIAFGDGLAFGAGVNLSNNAAARMAASRPEIRSLADRLSGIEQRIEHARQNNLLPGAFNQKMLEAVVAVVDSRLQEQSAEFEQRLATEVAAIRSEFHTQLLAARQSAEEENQLLRREMASMQRDFAETLARIVDEQVATTVTARIAPVENELRQEIHDQAGRTVGLVATATDEYVNDRLQPVQSEIADLQRRLGENDRNTLDLILALGQVCLQTAERLSPPELPQGPSPLPAGPPAAVAAAPPAISEPESAGSPEPLSPRWRAPLVSSFFAAATGLLLLHYL